MDKKTIAIILLVVLCATFAYFSFNKPKPKDPDKLIHRMEDSLIKVNTGLKHNYDSLTTQNNKRQTKIDSLENLKPKTVIQYVKIYEKIDRSTTHELTNQFDTLFTGAGLK